MKFNEELYEHFGVKEKKAWSKPLKAKERTTKRARTRIYTKKVAEEPALPKDEEQSGTWETYNNLYTHRQGLVARLIHWRNELSIDDCKKMCVQLGYHAVQIFPEGGKMLRGSVNFIKFGFELKKEHLRPLSLEITESDET